MAEGAVLIDRRKDQGTAVPDVDRIERLTPPSSTLVMVIGVAGVGKSEFSKSLLRRLNMVYISIDTITDPFARGAQTSPDGNDNREPVHDVMYGIVQENLKQGNSVLLDAPFVMQMADPEWRNRLQSLLSETGARLRVIRLVCSDESLRNRLTTRDLPRDREKLGDWPAFRVAQPMWFPIPFEHRDLCVETIMPDHLDAAVRYIVGPEATRIPGAFEALRVLWQGQIDSFNERRRYEWQMCLAVWGALAGVVVASLSEKAHLTGCTIFLLIILGAAFASVLTYWLTELQRRNNGDRRIGEVYWDAMRQYAPERLPTGIEQGLLRHRQRRYGGGWGWNHGSQIVVTWLVCLAMAVVLLGAGSKTGERNADAKAEINAKGTGPTTTPASSTQS